MALQIIRNNIINVEADAIVNTANPRVGVGAGVDHAIYSAAGWDELLEARRAIGEMQPGDVAVTPAFRLSAKHIIHAVGPAWRGGGFGERETVAACYRKSLALARELKCESIAFPLMATGTYGFPKDEALRIAMSEISGFLLENEMEVMLVVYDRESFEVSGKLFSDIREYIGDGEAEAAVSASEDLCLGRSIIVEDACNGEPADVDLEADFAAGCPSFAERPTLAPFPSEQESLDQRLKHLDKTFQQYLFMLIDRRGLSDPEVYKRANIDRKHFSKIRSNIDYTPSKKTALALAIALELSLDETKDLLARAGLALSPSIMSDRIIEYCIENRQYDIFEINCVLFKYEQPTLGA